MKSLLLTLPPTDAPPERTFARISPDRKASAVRPSMRIHDAQRVVLETTATRDKAEALLESLRRARRESDRQMKALGMSDKLREATGRSLYDNAIESTQKMVDTLSNCVRDAKRDICEPIAGLTAAEQRELDELDAEVLGHEARGHDHDASHVRSGPSAPSVAPAAR